MFIFGESDTGDAETCEITLSGTQDMGGVTNIEFNYCDCGLSIYLLILRLRGYTPVL